MSEQQSNLSSAHYGYDFVVATTQQSINATMKEFLNGAGSPEVILCYVMDGQGNPVQVDYASLKADAKGSDPFNVPNGADPATNQDLKNLAAASFMYAFKAKLGLPPGYPPQNTPDIVRLGGNTATVNYNLTCSEFVVVEANYGPRGIIGWLNQSQQPGAAWIFTSKVDLRMGTADQSAYSTLPPAVQKQIKNLGGNAFSVQQLLFDLDNAALQTVPTISGVAPGTPLYTALQTVFLGAYFTALQKAGKPVLGYSITQSAAPPSSLVLTDLNLEVSPFVGTDGQPVGSPTPQQQQLSTLNYLCAANGNTLPPASPFTWNWVDPSQAANFHGVVAINRNTFANYFLRQLTPLIQPNCFKSQVRVWLSGFLDTTINYSWSLTGWQTPVVTRPTSGPIVLQLGFQSNASDDAGLGGDMGAMSLAPSLDVTVTFAGNAITVTQHLVINLYVRVMQTSGKGNIVDKTITDTYTLGVNQAGDLTTTLTSTTTDKSEDPRTNDFLNFFTDLNRIISDISTWTRNFVGTRFTDLPVSVAQSFVFPGGKTFAFKDVVFSANQDLVSHITYVQPS